MGRAAVTQRGTKRGGKPKRHASAVKPWTATIKERRTYFSLSKMMLEEDAGHDMASFHPMVGVPYSPKISITVPRVSTTKLAPASRSRERFQSWVVKNTVTRSGSCYGAGGAMARHRSSAVRRGARNGGVWRSWRVGRRNASNDLQLSDSPRNSMISRMTEGYSGTRRWRATRWMMRSITLVPFSMILAKKY